MNEKIIALVNRHQSDIKIQWANAIPKTLERKISKEKICRFIDDSINALKLILQNDDYSQTDDYLITACALFGAKNIDLLQASRIFSCGRTAVLFRLEKEETLAVNLLKVADQIESVFERLFARYCVIHQESKMKELTHDRDKLASKLEDNRLYLSNILFASDSAIMVIDEKEKIIDWNKGAESIFGYSESEAVGQSSNLLLPENEFYQFQLERIKSEVQTKGYIKISETERLTKDGRIIPIELVATKLPSKNGAYVGRTVIIKDYSHVKKLQRQIDQSEKLAVIGQLAAGVAHEIGNPLTSISSIVQILQRKTTDELFVEQLSQIKANIDRITKIVRELVDFSRPPGDEMYNLNISDLIKTALGIVKYDKRVKKVKFETNLTDNLPKIKVVPDQLLQVFVNILLNALDAVSEEGAIKVCSRFDEQNIYIEFIDDGIGMSEETKEKIFDPFFTTKEVGKGTGLGLSVSYGIIKKFKGEISAESELGKGSRFTIKLPIEQ